MNSTEHTKIQEHENVFCIFKNCEDDISCTLKKAFRAFLKGKIMMNESIEKSKNKI